MNTSWIAPALIHCGAVAFGDFTLSGGQKSTYYIDLKKALCSPNLLDGIVREISQMMGSTLPDLWAGVELGAVPLAVAASLISVADKRAPRTGVPYIIVRKKPKDHGTQKLIEGPYTSGQTVCLLEDVVTTGESSANAVRILREAGLPVRSVVAVVDREQGGAGLF